MKSNTDTCSLLLDLFQRPMPECFMPPMPSQSWGEYPQAQAWSTRMCRQFQRLSVLRNKLDTLIRQYDLTRLQPRLPEDRTPGFQMPETEEGIYLDSQTYRETLLKEIGMCEDQLPFVIEGWPLIHPVLAQENLPAVDAADPMSGYTEWLATQLVILAGEFVAQERCLRFLGAYTNQVDGLMLFRVDTTRVRDAAVCRDRLRGMMQAAICCPPPPWP